MNAQHVSFFWFVCLFFFEAVQPPCKNGSVEQLFVFEGHNKRKSHFDFSPHRWLVGQGFTVTSESKAICYKANELTRVSKPSLSSASRNEYQTP